MRISIFFIIYFSITILQAQQKMSLCSHLFSDIGENRRNPWIQSMFKHSMEELKQIGYQELGLSEGALKIIVENKKSSFGMNITEGSNNDGIYIATTNRGTLYLKKIRITYSFDVDSFRQQAAAALTLSQLGLGPKAGVYFSSVEKHSTDWRMSLQPTTTIDSPKEAYIIMREGMGVPIPGSKLWKWNYLSLHDRETAKNYIKHRIEADLNKKFTDFNTAHMTWTNIILNHHHLKQKILEAAQLLEKVGLGGSDVEILLSTQGDGSITIIDTTSVFPVDINRAGLSLSEPLMNFYNSITSHQLDSYP